MPKGVYQHKPLSIEHKRKLSEFNKGKIKPYLQNTGRTRFKKGDKRLLGNKTAKGHIPWNKGTKGIMEAWNKGKQRLEIRKEKNPMWKGGMGTKRHQAMGRIEYIIWRTETFKRDKYICQICGKKGYLEADHKVPWSLNENKRYEISNGITMCKECHLLKTFVIDSKFYWGGEKL